MYRSITDINIYDSPQLERLATQMAAGRYLDFVRVDMPKSTKNLESHAIALLEDGYQGFIRNEDLANLEVSVGEDYVPQFLTKPEIRERVEAAIAYTKLAMQQPNRYLWGGTVPPDFDCSGLMQAAFASVGIWLPRDAYQQEAFLEPVAIPRGMRPAGNLELGNIELDNLEIGDFIFFGNPQKATHVGMYLGKGEYIHSSGQEHGHNGIAISSLVTSESGSDRVSKYYGAQLRGAGRVTQCYQGM
jgi:hypothetical protein